MLTNTRTIRRLVRGCVGLLALALPAAAQAYPPIPTGVHALRPLTNTPPVIAWDPVPGATAYRIWRADGSTCERNSYLATVNANAVTQFTDVAPASTRPATPDATYGYTVRTVIGELHSDDSACVTVTWDSTPPTIAGLQAAAQPDGSLSVGWTTVNGADAASIQLRRSVANGPAPAGPLDGVQVCAPGADHACVDSSALSGATYAYTLFAADGAGNLASASSSAAASDVVAPSGPTGVSGTVGLGTVDLDWNAVPAVGPNVDVAGYLVVEKQGVTPPASPSDGVPACTLDSPAVHGCTVGGLVGGQPVTFAVFSRDEVPNYSAIADAWVSLVPLGGTPPASPAPTLVDRVPPGRPRDLRLHLGVHGATLSWRNPGDTDFDHVVLVRNDKRRPRSLKDGVALNAGRRGQLDLPASHGERLHVALFAYDRTGNVAAPAFVDVTMPVLTPVAGSVLRSAPVLAWRAVCGARYYNVQVLQGARRVGIAWPVGARFQVPARWLARGARYTWYVWPGLGAQSAHRYGPAIGHATFTVK